MRLLIQSRAWLRAFARAWRALQLVQPAKLVGCVAISILNLLWVGHGVLRSLPAAPRFVVVLLLAYALTTVAEFLWLLFTMPRPVDMGFPDATIEAAPQIEVDPLVEQLRELPPSELKEGTLQLADDMRSFEAGTDGAYVSTLLRATPLRELSEEECDRELERESRELMQSHLATWRAYRERFLSPARAFRDELRRRLGIWNPKTEPEIPALDEPALTGAKPITKAADYLAALARRLP